MKNNNAIWAIILAAGKGTRMKSKDKNKVTLMVAGVPMLSRTISNIKKAGIEHVLVVVGFAKESVASLLDRDIVLAEQKKRLGTGHAVKVAMEKIPSAKSVLVLYGDDSYMYGPDILSQLATVHRESGATLTFLTLLVDNPKGLGRIVRNKAGQVMGIVEEKDATEEQKKITEINPACYIFDYTFLKRNIKKIKKSPVTQEYYLTSLIEMAVEEQVKIETVQISGLKWRGVNTPEELQEAEKIFTSLK